MKKILEDADHIAFYGESRHTWKEAVLKWNVEASKSLRAGTLKRYLVSLKQIRGHLNDLYVDEVTTRTIAKIAGRKGITNATRRRDLTAASSVLRYCVAQGWRDDNPAKAWDRGTIRETRAPIVLPDPSDIDVIVGRAPGNLAKMIRSAQYTGMREEELGGLEQGQVRRQEREVDIWNSKTNRPRTIELDDRAWGTLEGTARYLNSRWVFWHSEGKRYQNIASRFAGIVKKAEALRLIGRRFRFHDLRHWYAVDYLRRGGNIYDLQQILGHDSIKTTERYLAYLTVGQQKQAKYGVAQERAQ